MSAYEDQACRFTLFNDGEGGAYAECLTHESARFKKQEFCWVVALIKLPEDAAAEQERRRRERYQEDADDAITRIGWWLSGIGKQLDVLGSDQATLDRRGLVEAMRTLVEQMETVRKKL